MRRLLCYFIFACSVSGCATDLRSDNGSHRKIVTPCGNDNLCVRETYNVVWDNGIRNNSQDYPVSYRPKQTEYILVPENSDNCKGDCGGVR